FGARGAEAEKWQCSVCDLLSPDSAVACVVCKSPRPANIFGFKPSGGLSFAGLAAALGPSSSSASAPFGTLPKSFPSFAPPNSAAALPAASPMPTFSGFKPSSGLLLTQTPIASAAPNGTAGAAAKPAPLFSAFAPPAGMAPMATIAVPSSLGTAAPALPVASAEDKQWTCELCELKNSPHITVCHVCETLRPSASVAVQSTEPNVAESSTSADTDKRLEHNLSASNDGEEHGAAELSDGQHSDDGDGDDNADDNDDEDNENSEHGHSGDSVDHTQSDWNTDNDEDLASDVESDVASDVESDVASDAESDVASDAESDVASDAESHVISDAGDMGDARLETNHPVLSYADAAKVALADNSGEEEAGVEEAVSSSLAADSTTNVAENAIVASNDSMFAEAEPTLLASAQAREGEHEHDHDSDGFVHISQLESGMHSNVDVSQVDDDALSVIASEEGLDSSVSAAPSTGEHVSEMASELGDKDAASDTESKIFAAVSDELDRGVSEAHDSVAEEARQQPTTTEPVASSDIELPPIPHFELDPYLVQLLSGASISLVVEQALLCHPASILEPEPDTTEALSMDAKTEEVTNASPDALTLAVASQPDESASAPLSVPAQQQSGSSSALIDMDDLAVGIASTFGDLDTTNDSADDLPSDIVREQASPKPDQQISHYQSPATGIPNAKAFFKAGSLGNFGSQLSKTTIGVSTGANSGLSSGNSALPNAFSASAAASVPAFGAKLDRPAFGIASMSSFGAGSSSQPGQQPADKQAIEGIANMGKIGSGFSSRASPSIDPFAAYKGHGNLLGSSPAAAKDTSEKSSPLPSFAGSPALKPSGLDSSPRLPSKSNTKPATPQPSIKTDDPIRSIIHGSDSEEDKDDLDVDYDTE
ncbi:hypothetical protein GGI21_001758, partial [Coemansia aciculifera]